MHKEMGTHMRTDTCVNMCTDMCKMGQHACLLFNYLLCTRLDTCLEACIYTELSTCLYVCLYTCLSMSIHVSLHVSIHGSIHVSVHVCVRLGGTWLFADQLHSSHGLVQLQQQRHRGHQLLATAAVHTHLFSRAWTWVPPCV